MRLCLTLLDLQTPANLGVFSLKLLFAGGINFYLRCIRVMHVLCQVEEVGWTGNGQYGRHTQLVFLLKQCLQACVKLENTFLLVCLQYLYALLSKKADYLIYLKPLHNHRTQYLKPLNDKNFTMINISELIFKDKR